MIFEIIWLDNYVTGQWYPKATINNHPLPILFTHIIPKIIVPLKFLVSTGIPVVCGVDNSSHKLAGKKNGNLPMTLFYFCRQKIVLEKNKHYKTKKFVN